MNELLVDLLARCKNGESDAIVELIKRFRPWALDFAAAILDDKDLAEDTVQEAFLTALQRLDDLRDANAFPGWLRTIIRTHALRIARGRRELSLDAGTEPHTEDSHEDKLEREELRAKVQAALEALPNTGRETTELFYFNEMSCSEISNHLHVPQGTVRRRLHDSRMRLRSMLLGYINPEPVEDHIKQNDRNIPL